MEKFKRGMKQTGNGTPAVREQKWGLTGGIGTKLMGPRVQ